MNKPLPDDLPSVDLLAAFLDGKLNAAEQARVEQWLSDYPEAAGELNERDARTLFDEAFWKEVAPPRIAVDRWDSIVSEVQRVVMLQHPVRRARSRLVAVGVLASVAASVLVFFIFQSNVPNPTRISTVQPAAVTPKTDDDEVFLVAENHEVEIFRMPGAAQTALVVGEHPLDSAPLSLATKEDLEVFSFGGMPPGEVDKEEPGATMIWPPQKK